MSTSASSRVWTCFSEENPLNIKAFHIFVSGRVQGVSFRASTEAEARRLGVSGWVRNLTDGRVEIWAEGPVEEVEALVSWCRGGPVWARVERAVVEEVEPVGCEGFEVRRGG